jgi:hypothetical protein
MENTNITLTKMNIIQKLGNLNELRSLHFHKSNMFRNTNSDVLDEWLRNGLVYFPRSLESIRLLGYRLFFMDNDQLEFLDDGELYYLKLHEIESQFKDSLPNLRTIVVNNNYDLSTKKDCYEYSSLSCRDLFGHG